MNVLVMLLLLLTGHRANLRTTDFVFANCDKTPYTWFTQWGAFVANVRDTHDSDVQWSRWTISQDGLIATRSVYRVVDGWIMPTDEVSLSRASIDADWKETARQTYQGTPRYLPVTISGPGSVTTSGTWSWHDSRGHVGHGDWRYTNTWTWDGDRLIDEESYDQQTDGETDWKKSDRIEYFTRSGFIGFNDKVAGYTACLPESACKKL
jgi:hypothetical protein